MVGVVKWMEVMRFGGRWKGAQRQQTWSWKWKRKRRGGRETTWCWFVGMCVGWGLVVVVGNDGDA